MDPDADPGWAPAVLTAFFGLIPGWGWRHRTKRSRSADGLTTLRVVYLSFLLSFCLIGLIVAVLENTGSEMASASEGLVTIAVMAVGAASLVGGRLVRRPLPCDDESALAAGYRQQFFLRVAVAQSGGFAGFVGYMASSAGWLYPLGALFTAIGFIALAPTAKHLRQEQDDLRRQGCALSLVSALRQLRERR